MFYTRKLIIHGNSAIHVTILCTFLMLLHGLHICNSCTRKTARNLQTKKVYMFCFLSPYCILKQVLAKSNV